MSVYKYESKLINIQTLIKFNKQINKYKTKIKNHK